MLYLSCYFVQLFGCNSKGDDNDFKNHLKQRCTAYQKCLKIQDEVVMCHVIILRCATHTHKPLDDMHFLPHFC